MINYKYGYLLAITNDMGLVTKYDYLLSNYELFKNSAAYYDLSGIDLCLYNLQNKEDNTDFFDRLNIYKDKETEKIDILFDLALTIHEFMEAE